MSDDCKDDESVDLGSMQGEGEERTNGETYADIFGPSLTQLDMEDFSDVREHHMTAGRIDSWDNTSLVGVQFNGPQMESQSVVKQSRS